MATVFEIRGQLGMYRKPYTTTSSASFPIPTPTALGGLIAAVIGLDNGAGQNGCHANYWPELSGTRIAIQRLNQPAWFSAVINFWNTKNPQKSPHIQIKHQFIKDPHFRIFVEGGVESKLREMLEQGSFVYTPTLGAAYALAQITYRGSFTFESALIPTGQANVPICSAVPLPEDDTKASIDYLQSKGLMKDIFPFRLDTERAVKQTIALLYPSQPVGRIFLDVWKGLDVCQYEGDHIAWLPAW